MATGLVLCLPFKGASQSWYYDFSPGSPAPVTTIGSPSITSGTGGLKFTNAAGANFRRVCYDLGANLSTQFRMDFDFIYQPNGAGNGMAHWLAAATSSALDPTCSSISPAVATSLDLIGVMLLTPGATSPAGAGLCIGVKKGTTEVESSSILVSPTVPYYVTLERHGNGTLKLMVFTNPLRTTQVAGSPICFSAFDNSVGTGATPLRFMQHAVVAWGAATRTMTGELDNLKIDNIASLPAITAAASQTLCAPGDIPNPLTVSVAQPQFIATYQWQVYTLTIPLGWAWVNISGATDSLYSPPGLTRTRQYRCLCTIGCATTYTSNTVTVTVNQFNPLIDCNIGDDYTVGSPLWTQTGTDVVINTFGGYCLFKATPDAPNSQRVARNIGLLPNSKWRADFDFTYDGSGSFNPHHYIVAFTSSNAQPISASQDIIYAQIATTAGNVQIWGGSKDNTGSIAATPTGITIASATYYISIERLCSTKGRISVFTDAGRTTHATGSPQYFTINPLVSSLAYIQHSNDISYVPASRLTGQIDNLCIDNNYLFGGHRMASSTNDEGNIETVVKNSFNVYPNPSADVFAITLDKVVNGLIEVYDISGKKVKSVELNQGLADYKLDLSGYSKGVYMLNFISNGKIESKKIILE